MTRRWLCRLAQLSPFVMLALILGGWLIVPTEARMISATQPYPGSAPVDPFEYSAPGVDVQVMQGIAMSLGSTVSINEEDLNGIKATAGALASVLASEPARLFDGEGRLVPEALPASDPVFNGIRAHDLSTGGRASCYVLPIDPSPRVALSAIGDISVLSSAERRELETSGTLQSLRSELQSGEVDNNSMDFSQLNAGSGSEINGRYFLYGLSAIGGHVYEIYGVCRSDRSAALEMPQTSGWERVDTAENREVLDKTARRARGCVFIVGPIDGEPVLLRAALGAKREGLVPLVRAEFDHVLTSSMPFSLTPAMARAAEGARWGAVAVGGRAAIRSTDATTVAVLLVGSYDQHPSTPALWDAIGDTPFRRAQVFFAAHFATIEGALGALMLVSLIAAPVAFVSERRRFEQLDIERERERVQREARTRVVDRLTRLSDDMDRSAANAADKVRCEVVSVSDDIQATVAELKSILGDAPSTNGDRDE